MMELLNWNDQTMTYGNLEFFYDFERYLCDNLDKLSKESIKEYCEDNEVTPTEAGKFMYQQVLGAIDGLHESACERYNEQIDRFDISDMFNYDIPDFFDEHELLMLIKQVVRKRNQHQS